MGGGEVRPSTLKLSTEVQERITKAGGTNRFDEPNFRVVWGRDRIVPIHGFWDDTGTVETRFEPKYLPDECWHLEMWRAPEEYGTPETWKEAGKEVSAGWTVDTAGPFPSRGEYELVFPFTSDMSANGTPIPLEPSVCEWIINLIRNSRNFTFWQRRQAIAQREEKKKHDRIERNVDMMKNQMRPFGGSGWASVSGQRDKKIILTDAPN